jgi:hypothetical protein
VLLVSLLLTVVVKACALVMQLLRVPAVASTVAGAPACSC